MRQFQKPYPIPDPVMPIVYRGVWLVERGVRTLFLRIGLNARLRADSLFAGR